MTKKIKILKVEQTQINKNHKLFEVINDFSFKSKNMYNYANYVVRKEFIENRKLLRHQHLQTLLKNEEPYKELMSQSAQCVLQVLERNWKSFFNGMKQWKKNPSKFNGMPKIPNYLPKNKGWTWFLKNNQTYIKDGLLYFKLKKMQGYGFKTNVKGRLIAVRFVPRNDIFVMEIVYEEEIEVKNVFNNNYAGIDLGISNFITMSNNVGLNSIIIKGGYIKSENQWYNKRRALLQSQLKSKKWSKKLDKITRLRYNRIKNYIHHSTKYIIDYCLKNNIDNIVVGLNEKWKQKVNIGDKNNQNFVQIPYDMAIKQLQYKCKYNGLNLITTEESYTSGTSFIDNELPIKENYDKSRRIKRGLFRSNKGKLINSDVNGSLQIIKKVNSNALSYELVGCLNPLIIRNVVNYYKC